MTITQAGRNVNRIIPAFTIRSKSGIIPQSHNPSVSDWSIVNATTKQWLRWADELRAMAHNGLLYASNDYDKARYTRLRQIAAEMLSLVDGRPAETLAALFAGEIAYATPKAVADSAIFNAAGEILLVQRRDDRLWAMPGGILEVGESAAAGAVRETWEETGLRVAPQRLIGVYDSRTCGTESFHQLYHFVFLCSPVDDARPQVTHETLDVGFFPAGQLPPLSPGHPLRVADAFWAYRDPGRPAFFDLPTPPLTSPTHPTGDETAFTFHDPGPLRDGDLELVLMEKYPGDPALNYVPAYRFKLFLAGQGQEIGRIDFRAVSTPSIVLYAGHLGYWVAPEHRGHHYAARACRLLLPLARSHGLKELWITCNPDNFASRRTCELAGARFVAIIDLPEESDMYQKGERLKCRYRLEL